MKIVITGGTSGLGYALMISFLEEGHDVAFCARSEQNIIKIISESNQRTSGKCYGFIADVSCYEQFLDFKEYILSSLGSVDLWINNAGLSGSKIPLVEEDPKIIHSIVNTNLLGSIYGTRIALEIMTKQGYGKIFNVEGRGSNGRKSPNLATYSTTKYALVQFQKTLVEETKESSIGIHSISPGMILTPLLIEGTKPKAKQIFNILAEPPMKIAQWLLPKMKEITGSGKRIKYLTRRKAMVRFIFARKYKNKYFNENGEFISQHIEQMVYPFKF